MVNKTVETLLFTISITNHSHGIYDGWQMTQFVVFLEKVRNVPELNSLKLLLKGIYLRSSYFSWIKDTPPKLTHELCA